MPAQWYDYIMFDDFVVDCIFFSYTPKLPVGRLIGDVASEAFIIAVISFVINISQAKLMAQKNSYSIHPDQVMSLCFISILLVFRSCLLMAL